eukprot:TRINITY_DN10814_c0_g1_i1.p1 TRINITY_DN10814_c0_g1~~TRINITY_DN10814_c0_g1_i1.p1  ORF type:complete len:411 (-),score=105.70 TRINITY_DN10814_c0_g1_i1:60-1292(-)
MSSAAPANWRCWKRRERHLGAAGIALLCAGLMQLLGVEEAGWTCLRRGRVALQATLARSSKEDLKAAVSGIQSSGISGKKQWQLFVRQFGENEDLDPASYDADFLQDFVDNYQGGYRFSSPVAAMAECAQLETSGKFHKALAAYMSSHQLDASLADEKEQMVGFLAHLADCFLSDIDPDVLKSSVEQRHQPNWIKKSATPLGKDALQQLLEKTPQLNGLLTGFVLNGLAASDAKAATAVLECAAEVASGDPIDGFIVAMFRKVVLPACQSEDAVGEEGMTKLLRTYRGPSLNPLSIYILSLRDEKDVNMMLEQLTRFKKKLESTDGQNRYVNLLVNTRCALKPSKRPFGEKGVERAVKKYPELVSSLDPWARHLLAVADSQEAERALMKFQGEDKQGISAKLCKALAQGS